MVFLKADKILISILSEYIDFADIFSKNLVVKLPEHTKINDHIIDLIED